MRFHRATSPRKMAVVVSPHHGCPSENSRYTRYARYIRFPGRWTAPGRPPSGDFEKWTVRASTSPAGLWTAVWTVEWGGIAGPRSSEIPPLTRYARYIGFLPTDDSHRQCAVWRFPAARSRHRRAPADVADSAGRRATCPVMRALTGGNRPVMRALTGADRPSHRTPKSLPSTEAAPLRSVLTGWVTHARCRGAKGFVDKQTDAVRPGPFEPAAGTPPIAGLITSCTRRVSRPGLKSSPAARRHRPGRRGRRPRTQRGRRSPRPRRTRR